MRRTRRALITLLVAASALLTLSSPAGARPLDASPAPGRSSAGPVFVSVSAPGRLAAVRARLEAAGATVRRSYRFGALLVTPPEGVDAAAFARDAAAVSGVKAAGAGSRVHAVGGVDALATANDPLFAEQWALPFIGGTTAWDTATGSGVDVAVIDSGIDATHRDLSGQVTLFRNYVTPGGSAADDYGHGTHVAGIIAAVRDNAVDIAGAAPGAHVWSFKVLDSTGGGDMADAIAAIRDAVDETPCKVISMSFGGDLESNAEYTALKDAVDYANLHGRIVVAATGNDGQPISFYPAAMAGVIGVGSVGADGLWSSFENYGYDLVDVVAPGEDIVSTIPGDMTEHWAGTSMATPFVSASAALLWSSRPDLTAAQVTAALTGTAQDFGAVGRDQYYGYGMVRPDRAIAACDVTRPQTTCDAQQTYIGPAVIHLTASDAGGAGVAHTYYRVDAGAVAQGTSVSVAPPGQHSLEYWSVDAAGNAEDPHQTVTFTVIPGTFTITPSAGVGGRISPALAQTVVNGGSSPVFTVSPYDGFHTLDVRVDGVSVGPVQSYQFSDVAADHTIAATFAADTPLASSITIRTSTTRTTTGKTAVLSGAVTPQSTIGVNIVVYVMKPGRGYWTYSSNRTVYSLAGSPAWQYKYYFKPGMTRGTYKFKARCPAAGFAPAAWFRVSESSMIAVTLR